MPDLKITTGEHYRTRAGDITQIYDRVWLTTHPYTATNGHTYRANGRVGFFRESEHDLVEKVAAPQPGSRNILIEFLDFSIVQPAPLEG